MAAAMRARDGVVMALMDAGADAALVDGEGMNARMHAELSGHEKLSKLIHAWTGAREKVQGLSPGGTSVVALDTLGSLGRTKKQSSLVFMTFLFEQLASPVVDYTRPDDTHSIGHGRTRLHEMVVKARNSDTLEREVVRLIAESESTVRTRTESLL